MGLISREARALLLLLLLPAAVYRAAVAGEQEDTVLLTNGDVLHGRLLSIDPTDGVSWRHKYVKEPLVFSIDSLREIKLGASARSAGGGQVSVVRLTNDDVLHGRLISLMENKLRLGTSYADALVIHQPMISSIALVPSSDVVFEGPSGPEQWQISSAGSWEYKNNALYSNGSGYAGAQANLPDAAHIEFTVAWRGSYPYFRFAFYTANLSSYSSHSYSFRSSSSYLRMYRYGGSGSSSLPSHNHSGFADKSKVRFRIFADKKTKRIFIFMDDQKVVQWTEPQEWVGSGNAVVFYSYSSHRLKVTDFIVRKWDGSTLPDKGVAPQKTPHDVLELVNGDKVTGALNAINEGKLSFKTSYASIDVPMKRVAAISMSDERAERARRNRNDVRVHFADTSSMTLDIKGLKERRITGSSENYGDVTVSMDPIVKLDFNIYDEPEKQSKDDW